MTEIFSAKTLAGKNAFFNKIDYTDELKKTFSRPLASCLYQADKNNPIGKSSKGSLSSFIAKPLVLPAMIRPKQFGEVLSKQPDCWKFKRLNIQTLEGLSLDAAIMGRPSTLSNKKWVLVSEGRSLLYENRLVDKAFQNFLTQINANALVFNYPSVGASTGNRNTKNLVNSYHAMLQFLEDNKRGIGAKKIIGYGYSIGGGIQGESLKTHNLQEGIKKGIRYIFIKDRTFSSLERVCKSITKGCLQWLIPYAKLSLESVESSKKLADLKIPEIIIQTTDEDCNPISDGVISKKAALQTVIKALSFPHKAFIYFTEKCINNTPPDRSSSLFLHVCSMEYFSERLAKKINSLLRAYILA
jgi:hypothetical protein